jgi:uncharacterized protein YndB with AHSA1/START domain
MLDTPQQQSPAQVRVDRSYPFSVEKVWRAWTDPQALSHWFGKVRPGTVTEAEIDLREGGHYRIVSRLPDGGTNEVSGHYLQVLTHRRLVFTWAWRSTPERVSRVCIDLVAQDTGTVMHFVHDQFFDEQARINHARGWATLFEQFDTALHAKP